MTTQLQKKPIVRAEHAPAPAIDIAPRDVAPRLARAGDGRLMAERAAKDDGGADARAWIPVRVQRCFPWSEPGRLFSLRDEENDEVAFVADTAELDADSRAAFEGALAESGFVFEVVRLYAVTEEFELRHWVVETRQGARSFQTARDEWPRDIPGGGLLLRDVAGDLYRFPDPDTLDPASQRILWAYLE